MGRHGLNGIVLYFLIKSPDARVNMAQALQLLMYCRIGSVQAAKLLQDFAMSSTVWFCFTWDDGYAKIGTKNFAPRCTDRKRRQNFIARESVNKKTGEESI